ncbi:hypothetical protein [Methanoculleus frigidifontis]|nr:hypothetical protein [Methanoculleus sp. FWC-SCC1]
MRCVPADPAASGTAPLYCMHRDLALSEDGSQSRTSGSPSPTFPRALSAG